MIDNGEIMKLLQIAGGNFPIGGFSQSYGLETYISKGYVKTVPELRELLETYISNVYCRNEIPVLCAAYYASASSDFTRLASLNEVAVATKISKESREASCKSGRAMLRVGLELISNEDVRAFYESKRSRGISFNVAFAIVACNMKISLDNTMAAYVFNAVNGLVQAAIKLMPLGNIEGQQLLRDLMPAMDRAIKEAKKISIYEISNFAPSIDLASIEHEVLDSRLYMS